MRNRGGRHLEQLGDQISPTRRRVSRGAVELTDRALDPFQQVGERRQIVERRQTAQWLNRLEHLLQRIVHEGIRPERSAGAVESAGDGCALAGDEGARAGIEAHRFRRAHLC